MISLFTLGSIHSIKASGAEQMHETNILELRSQVNGGKPAVYFQA